MSLWEKFKDAATGDWGKVAVTVGAGLLGRESSKSGTQTTQQEKMDPRMDRYVYGPDGQSGLLGSAFGLAQKQLETGGLNDMQRQGMDMQRQFLMSPQYQQGYGNMMGLGQNLMGAGIAGNPFTGGQRTTMGQANPFQYQNLSNAQLPDYSSAKPQMVQPATTQAPQTGGLLGMGGNRSGSGGGVNTSPGMTIGTGNMTDAIDAAAKAQFNKYIALGLTPAVAAALVQKAMGTTGVLGAVNEAADPLGALNAVQGWTDTDPSYNPWSGGGGGTHSDGSAKGSANGFGGVSGNSYGGSFRGGGISNR
jgi:hypothetical protein